MAEPRDWEQEADRLAAQALAAGSPTSWFDQLYAAGVAGRVHIPWSRDEPQPLLSAWAEDRGLTGGGRRAVVVGCGLGADAEYVSSLGFETLGFDISPTAIGLAQERNPRSSVSYVNADLLDLPREWRHAYDLVVEVFTVQNLPDPLRRDAIANIGHMVAAGGTLLVIHAARDDDAPLHPDPPWPLRRDEVEAFAADGLSPVRIEFLPARGGSGKDRWRAEFHRG
ncbi:MAG TPA: class I SAM-dependent methyltransferase [Streptosporangiaceae bacterium]|nr:class I SAM-dependent methyltransferase [Streptosporangiaceae bacterium]